MGDIIRKYRNGLICGLFWRNICRFVAVLLSAACMIVITFALMGWIEKYKVEGVIGKVILLFFVVVLLAIALFIGYKMVIINNRYRCAITRTNTLLFRVRMDKDNGITRGEIDRELQLIARILESSPNHDKYLNL